MILTTRNSVYRLYKDGDDVVLKKVRTRRGRSSEFGNGATFRGKDISPVKVGGSAWIGGMETSVIEKIRREKGDDEIVFRK